MEKKVELEVGKQPEIKILGSNYESKENFEKQKEKLEISSNNEINQINMKLEGNGSQNQVLPFSKESSNQPTILDELFEINLNYEENYNLIGKKLSEKWKLNNLQYERISLFIRLFQIISLKYNINCKTEEKIAKFIEEIEVIIKTQKLNTSKLENPFPNSQDINIENDNDSNKKFLKEKDKEKEKIEEIKGEKEQNKYEDKISESIKWKNLNLINLDNTIEIILDSQKGSKMKKAVYILSRIFLLYKKEFQQINQVLPEELNELEKIYPMTAEQKTDYNRRREAIQFKEKNEKENEMKIASINSNKPAIFPDIEGGQNIINDSFQNIKASIPPNQFQVQNQKINIISIAGKLDGFIDEFKMKCKNIRVIDIAGSQNQKYFIYSLMEMKFESPKALIINKEYFFLSNKKLGNSNLNCRAEINQFQSFISKNSKYLEMKDWN